MVGSTGRWPLQTPKLRKVEKTQFETNKEQCQGKKKKEKRNANTLKNKNTFLLFDVLDFSMFEIFFFVIFDLFFENCLIVFTWRWNFRYVFAFFEIEQIQSAKLQKMNIFGTYRMQYFFAFCHVPSHDFRILAANLLSYFLW